MDKPTLTDYVALRSTMFDHFWQQQHTANRGHPFDYSHKLLIIFFMLMQQRRISAFKAQHRWLDKHPQAREQLGFASLPDRTTLSRRYKALYSVIQAFVAFSGAEAASVEHTLAHNDLYTDKSLFKANGPVWHQADRKAERVPDKLRHLDRDASWSKSGYHGWVYGYGLHLTCNTHGFPLLLQVETGAVADSQVIDGQATTILTVLRPDSVSADNSYTQAGRIRRWAKQGVMLLTPATKWRTGRYPRAYHQFLRQPDVRRRLQRRRSAIEPMFEVVARVLGTTARQKQLPLQGLANVRTCLALAVLTVQIAMVANCIWGLPPRTISELMTALT